MDMKHILQVLDKASSRKVEGANDMRRFVSAVRILNQPIDEAGKPGDPGFKPNLQVPQAPPFPEGDFSKPGPYDLGNGEKLTVNQDGTRVHSSGAGTFTYDKAGKAIKYASPMFNGLSQEHDLSTGNITVKYISGPLNIVKTYNKTGKETGASDAEYDLGVAKLRRQQDANKNVTNTTSVPIGGDTHVIQQQQPATEGKDDIRRFVSAVQVLNAPIEEASGYIPKNKKEAKDPRWSNALTVDIQPGAVEKNLKALGLAEGKKNFLDYLNEAEQGVAEDKQKGVDGKVCWDGYKRMGTKKKGGKTVDNCVPTGKK